jgi:serine/threonine-protein kinase
VARFVGRHRLGVAAAAAIVAALVVGLLLALSARSREAAAARRAAETRDFLVGLFEEASPERNGGVTPTLADVLAEGTRRIEVELTGEPALRADLLATLARLHLELGDFERGLELARRQAEVAVTVTDVDSIARVESRALLGEALHRTEKHAEALAELDGARAVAVRVAGPESLAVARVDVLRGVALWRLGRAPEGEKAVLAARAVLERELGPDADEAAGALADQMSLVFAQTDYRRAYELAKELLARRRRALPAEHPAIARALHDVATSGQELDLNDEALAAYREAIAIHTASTGADHARTLESRKGLGSLLEAMGRFDEAEAELVATAEGWQRRYGVASYGYGDALNMLSIVRYRRGHYREAAESFELVAANFRERFGPENPSTLSVQNNLGATLAEAGELDRAEQVLTATLEVRRRVAPKGDWLSTLNFLGRVARERGRLDEAESLHRESMALSIETHGAENTWTTTARYQLGLDLAAKGDAAAATAELEATLALDRKLRPADHPRLAELLLALARLDRGAGRLDLARERAGEAVTIRRKSLGEDDPRTAAAARELAALG